MDNICVILELNSNKIVVKKSNFSNVEYLNNGTVHAFIINSKRYIRCNNTSGFYGFLESENYKRQRAKFDKKVNFPNDNWRIGEFAAFLSLKIGVSGDIIEGSYNVYTQNGICNQLYHAAYDGITVSSAFNQTVNEFGSTFGCDNLGGITTPSGKFFNDFKDVIFWDTSQNDLQLIGEISMLLKKVGDKASQAFLNFSFDNSNFSTSFNSNILSSQNGYSHIRFENLKKNLILWVNFFEKNREKLKMLSKDEQLYVLLDTMYYYNMYEALTVDEIVRVLKVIAEKGHINNWKFESWDIGFINEEDIVIRLLKSVTTQSDATLLLNKLENTKTVLTKKNYLDGQIEQYTSLYKVLMYRMDDYGGDDNFTNFINQIERLIKVKNNIQLPITINNINDVYAITAGDFCWRGKGAVKGRITFDVESSSYNKIKIKETQVTETVLMPRFESQGVGTTSVLVEVGYEEVATQSEVNHYEFNHLDLVSIFFCDNPSFIDLSQDINQHGILRVTFAGYFEYLAEKQETANVELIVNTTLFIASLTIGFGELISAVRTINYARSFVGLLMVASDTAGYLASNTNFHNYLVAKYGVQKANEIIANMAFISMYVSVTTGAIIANGGLQIYGREESLKFVGTGEAILKDADALATLNPNQIVDLRNAVKIVKNELYAIKRTAGATQATETISRTKGAVIFYKFPEVKNELEALSDVARNRFFDDCVNSSQEFIQELDKTPDFIVHWDSLSDAQKISFKLDKIGYYEVWYPIRTEAKALERFNWGIIDPDSGKYGLHECRTWVDFETQSKGVFQAKPYGKIGDVIAVSGEYNGVPLAGKTIDFWGQNSNWNQFYQGTKRTRQIRKLLESIDSHFVKYFNSTIFPGESLDIFVMDLRYLENDSAIKTLILNKINDPNYFYKSLRDNPNYFTLINE